MLIIILIGSIHQKGGFWGAQGRVWGLRRMGGGLLEGLGILGGGLRVVIGMGVVGEGEGEGEGVGRLLMGVWIGVVLIIRSGGSRRVWKPLR
jgi:hypothetical protein